MNLDLKKYGWLAYPIGVGVAIIVSISILFGPHGLWVKMAQSGEQVKAQTIAAANLRTKLARLQAVNLQVENQNFEYLISVLPAQKNLPVLLSQISQAASNSGVILDSFKGHVGEVAASESATPPTNTAVDTGQLQLVVSLTVGSFDQLKQMIDKLESSLPLVEVEQVKYADVHAEMVVKGDWNRLDKLAAGSQYEIPDISADLLQLKGRLQTYSYLPPDTNQLPDVGVKDQPF